MNSSLSFIYSSLDQTTFFCSCFVLLFTFSDGKRFLWFAILYLIHGILGKGSSPEEVKFRVVSLSHDPLPNTSYVGKGSTTKETQ